MLGMNLEKEVMCVSAETLTGSECVESIALSAYLDYQTTEADVDPRSGAWSRTGSGRIPHERRREPCVS
jgi:hypothetical protein